MKHTGADVIIVIYRPDGTRVTRARGAEETLALWRARWVRGGYTARQVDEHGTVKEFTP